MAGTARPDMERLLSTVKKYILVFYFISFSEQAESRLAGFFDYESL